MGAGYTNHISQQTGMDEKMGKRGRMKEDRDRQVQMDRLRQKHVPVYMDHSWSRTHAQVLGYECQHLSSGSSRGSLARSRSTVAIGQTHGLQVHKLRPTGSKYTAPQPSPPSSLRE